MLSAASLPAFAKEDHWAELNQILRRVGKWAKFANAREEFEEFQPLKIEGLKLPILGHFSTRQN